VICDDRRKPTPVTRPLRLFPAALLVGATLGSLTLSPQVAGAATQTVTTCNDSGTGSLRQAVSNSAAGGTITFSLSPACSHIRLMSTIALTANLTIDGPGTSALIVDELIHKTAFSVSSGAVVAISGLNIENGAIGISNAGDLTVTDSTLSGNGSAGGGGIANTGQVTVTGSTLSGNGVDAPDEGGGAIDNQGGTVAVTDSTPKLKFSSEADSAGVSSKPASPPKLPAVARALASAVAVARLMLWIVNVARRTVWPAGTVRL